MIQTVMKLKVLKPKPGVKAEAALSTVSPVAVCSNAVVFNLTPRPSGGVSAQERWMVVMPQCGPGTAGVESAHLNFNLM